MTKSKWSNKRSGTCLCGMTVQGTALKPFRLSWSTGAMLFCKLLGNSDARSSQLHCRISPETETTFMMSSDGAISKKKKSTGTPLKDWNKMPNILPTKWLVLSRYCWIAPFSYFPSKHYSHFGGLKNICKCSLGFTDWVIKRKTT